MFPPRDRKVPVLESYLKQLEEDSRRWKASRQPNGNEDSSQGASTPVDSNHLRPPAPKQGLGDDAATIGPLNDPDVNTRNPLIEDRAWFVHDLVSTQPVYIGEAACTAFATRLRQFLSGNEPVAPLPRSVYGKDHVLGLTTTPAQQLPNKTYAHLLLKVALRFLGNDYHLMLRKTIIEKVDTLYRERRFEDNVFLCRLFALFAMGEMYTNRRMPTEKQPQIPGAGYFMQAISLLRGVQEEVSLSYIETLLVISIFSLALNRTNSAYAYAGIALRLSLILGLHRNLPEGFAISPVEREHRVRLWWSVYTMDRLTSSKLGHPVTVRDIDVDVNLPSMDGLSPSEQEEFSDPGHLVAHLQLARIIGDIISDIYGRSRLDHAFIRSVHQILKNLHSWAEALPDSVRLSLTGHATRNVASLHLCFNQCVILTTRPILFHVFKSQFQETASGGRPEPSPLTSALAEACIHASRSSNGLLAQLWVEGGMTIFGYFDAQYLFSSTIILLMSSALHHSEADRDAVETASDIMQSMVHDGNLPATVFYQHYLEIRKSADSSPRLGNGPSIRPVLGIDDAARGNSAPSVADHVNGLSALQTTLDGLLAQSDFQRGFTGPLEPTGDIALPVPWLFE